MCEVEFPRGRRRVIESFGIFSVFVSQVGGLSVGWQGGCLSLYSGVCDCGTPYQAVVMIAGTSLVSVLGDWFTYRSM